MENTSTTLENLYKFIDDNDIALEYIPSLKEEYNLDGLFSTASDKNIILLDSNLEKDAKKHISVLAEECGHYSTSYGNNIKNIDSYNTKVLIEKCELKADKWKCKFIIPDPLLRTKLLEHNSLLEVATDLHIDIDIVINRLTYLSHQSPRYWLSDNIYINLTSLPNLHKVDINNK